MSCVTELGYVRFGVSDLEEWKTFAREMLALEVCEEPGDAGSASLRMDYWHHRILLEESATDDLLGAGLRVAGAEEFKAIQATLKENGIPFELGDRALCAKRGVLEVLLLKDPAGNPLEIFHGPRIDTHLPFYPGRRMHGRYLTGAGGVGHMILSHQGLEPIYDFYKLLGMRGGIEYQLPMGPDATLDILFMHCNQRDHTFAFGLPPAEGKHINHLMLEVDNLDDVFTTYELVKASKYPIAIELGKHANDHMFSFYLVGPSGWQFEIGCGGKPATHQSEYFVRDTYGHEFQRGGASE
jgi:2,3-dihydroxyethylbenzene 1,2-dioxygenase